MPTRVKYERFSPTGNRWMVTTSNRRHCTRWLANASNVEFQFSAMYFGNVVFEILWRYSCTWTTIHLYWQITSGWWRLHKDMLKNGHNLVWTLAHVRVHNVLKITDPVKQTSMNSLHQSEPKILLAVGVTAYGVVTYLVWRWSCSVRPSKFEYGTLVLTWSIPSTCHRAIKLVISVLSCRSLPMMTETYWLGLVIASSCRW